MTSPSYSDAVRDLVTTALHDRECACGDFDPADEDEAMPYIAQAEAALDALAAAGHLREAINPGGLVAYVMADLSGMPRRHVGRVVQVGDDGLVTARFPQFDAPDMTVTAPADSFTRVLEVPGA